MKIKLLTSSVVGADLIKLVISSSGSMFESQETMAFLISEFDNLYLDKIIAGKNIVRIIINK